MYVPLHVIHCTTSIIQTTFSAGPKEQMCCSNNREWAWCNSRGVVPSSSKKKCPPYKLRHITQWPFSNETVVHVLPHNPESTNNSNFSRNIYAGHTANTMLTTTVNVRFAVLKVMLMKDSCLHEYHPVIDKWGEEAAAPTFQAPADPEDGRQSRFSSMSKSIFPSTWHYIPGALNTYFNTRHWLSDGCVCVCVCAQIGPNHIFCHLHLLFKSQLEQTGPDVMVLNYHLGLEWKCDLPTHW